MKSEKFGTGKNVLEIGEMIEIPKFDPNMSSQEWLDLTMPIILKFLDKARTLEEYDQRLDRLEKHFKKTYDPGSRALYDNDGMELAPEHDGIWTARSEYIMRIIYRRLVARNFASGEKSDSKAESGLLN